MPYINENQRELIDQSIDDLKDQIKYALEINDREVTDSDMLKIAGVLNYSITRLCASIIDNISYGKISIITGVLENVKQEFYRRAASPYEDKKITQNGDVKEYKHI